MRRAQFLRSGDVLILLLTLFAGAIGGVVVAVPAYWGTSREMDVKMVEIAVGILSQEPTDGIAPAREWAVEVISRYSAVPLSDAAKQALVESRAVRWSSNAGFGVYDTYTPVAP